MAASTLLRRARRLMLQTAWPLNPNKWCPHSARARSLRRRRHQSVNSVNPSGQKTDAPGPALSKKSGPTFTRLSNKARTEGKSNSRQPQPALTSDMIKALRGGGLSCISRPTRAADTRARTFSRSTPIVRSLCDTKQSPLVLTDAQSISLKRSGTDFSFVVKVSRVFEPIS